MCPRQMGVFRGDLRPTLLRDRGSPLHHLRRDQVRLHGPVLLLPGPGPRPAVLHRGGEWGLFRYGDIWGWYTELMMGLALMDQALTVLVIMKNIHHSKYIPVCNFVSGWCQDGNTSSRTITEVKNLELNLPSVNTTFWGVVNAVVEQSRRRANRIARGDGKFGPWGWPQNPSQKVWNLKLILSEMVSQILYVDGTWFANRNF